MGIGGRKGAKLFSPKERGNVRYLYTKRKVFWDKVVEMVHAGYTAKTAIDKMYDVYGNISVTQMIKKLREDKMKNSCGNPELRV